MILNDYKCSLHGVFEGSHPICPELGCESEDVIKVYLKAPGTRSDATKRFDAGIRKSAESMGISNFRSAQREGDTAYGGDAGKQLLWGTKEAEKNLGMNFNALTQKAAQGANYRHKDGTVEHVPDGMRQAASTGITREVLPMKRTERTVARQDASAEGKVAA
jgi:hypothetical protein